ncbi:Disease resistance protein TAO1 [Ananas comosus]|uniref:Disease resistance protein TAO1 n=1 Tax=Ananas comosus TaxID=4615 RepID=A0A199UKQ9_ANACO|nr:Disease resistance protein TAO1 [Ananas comosus]
MAEGIAFDLVTGVLGKLGSALWDEIGLLRSFKDDADDLRSNFSAIQAVLLDAEERSSAGKESHALRLWLRKLKDAAYDADGLLDEIRTQAALRQQQHPEVQNQNQPAEKVREFLSHANPMRLKFKVKMAHRMKELREKIGKIAKQRHDFGLAEAVPGRQAEFKRPETFSLVDEKTIVGRDDDKEKIVSITVMRRLRALQFRESGSLIMAFYSEAKCLRLLDLHGSEISMLPSSIGKLKLLRYLNLSSTNVQELPESITSLCNLQSLNLSGCRKIRTLPKFLGKLTNLQNLDLSDCRSLTIPDSISNLQNLYALNLSWCKKVISLESICHLKNLHYLNLSDLKFMETLPKSIESLQNLRILNLSNCISLLSLPSSLCDLKNLHDLNLSRLKSLVTLPESIGSLQNLRILNVSKCHSLLSLPSSSSDLQHLEKLDISGCKKLCELPKMIRKLTKLRVLLNNKCSELKGMPRGISKLVSLQELSVFVVGKQDRVEHCASISELEHLKLVGKLEIKGLENVTSPVDAKAANLIEKNLRSLKLKWNILKCPQLRPEPCLPPSVKSLDFYRTSKENLSLILERAMPFGGGDAAVSPQPPPDKGLRSLGIRGCEQLTCLPESLRSLTSLQRLEIWSCQDLERIEDWLGELTELQCLFINGCSSLRYLPAHKMTTLKILHIVGCPLLFDADGQFVDTSVDHIKYVYVDGSIDDCPLLFDAAEQFVDTSVNHIEEVSVNNSSPEESESSLKEKEKKGWTSCWSKIELVSQESISGKTKCRKAMRWEGEASESEKDDLWKDETSDRDEDKADGGTNVQKVNDSQRSYQRAAAR